MSDEPSSVDEVNRVNRCIDECKANAQECYSAFLRLYDSKRITAEQCIAGMNRCSKAHDLCTAQCVPQRRRFTDEQKQDFENLALEFAGIATVAAIAGLGAATLFDLPIAGGIIIGFGLGCAVESWQFGFLDRDPTDSNFSKVPVPSFPKLPPIRPVRNTRLTASVAAAANAVLANQAEAVGLLNVLLTALDRADGASRAGDASAEERQLKAARDFAKKIAKVFRDAVSLRLTLASKWKGPGLDFSISERDALKLRDEIIINGFPSSLLEASLKNLGVDRKDRDALLERLIIEIAKLQSFQSSFRDLLIDPKLRAAELRLVSALEQFSRFR